MNGSLTDPARGTTAWPVTPDDTGMLSATAWISDQYRPVQSIIHVNPYCDRQYYILSQLIEIQFDRAIRVRSEPLP